MNVMDARNPHVKRRGLQWLRSPTSPHQEARSLSIRPQSLGSETNGSGGVFDLAKKILWTSCSRSSAGDWSHGVKIGGSCRRQEKK